jgi:hypothetical protein
MTLLREHELPPIAVVRAEHCSLRGIGQCTGDLPAPRQVEYFTMKTTNRLNIAP